MSNVSFHRVQLEVSVPSESYHEPDQYIRTYAGDLIGFREDDDGEPDVSLGRVTLYIVERDRIVNDGASLFEAMDSLTGNTCDMYEALVDSDTESGRNQCKS